MQYAFFVFGRAGTAGVATRNRSKPAGMGGLSPQCELASVGAFSARRVSGKRRHRQQSGGGVAFLGVGVPVRPTRVSMQSGTGVFGPWCGCVTSVRFFVATCADVKYVYSAYAAVNRCQFKSSLSALLRQLFLLDSRGTEAKYVHSAYAAVHVILSYRSLVRLLCCGGCFVRLVPRCSTSTPRGS